MARFATAVMCAVLAGTSRDRCNCLFATRETALSDELLCDAQLHNNSGRVRRVSACAPLLPGPLATNGDQWSPLSVDLTNISMDKMLTHFRPRNLHGRFMVVSRLPA